MKVLVVCLGKFVGGGEIYSRRLVEGLCQRGDKVTIISSTDSHGDIHGIYFIKVKAGYSSFLKTAYLIRHELTHGGYDVVHFNGVRAGYISFFIKKCNSKFVLTKHLPFYSGTHHSFSSYFKKYVSLFIFYKLDRIICVSDAVKNDFALCVQHKLICVPNGVPDIGSSTVKSVDKTYDILFLGRLVEHKGILVIINAVLRHNANHPSKKIKLAIAGIGPLSGHVETVASNNPDCLSYLGFSNDVSHLLNSSKVLALISNNEGMPLSILEAFSCSIPVLTCNIPGVNEVVSHMHNGYLIQSQCADEVYDAVVNIFHNCVDELRTWGRNARADFQLKYNTDIMINNTVCVYNSLLGKF